MRIVFVYDLYTKISVLIVEEKKMPSCNQNLKNPDGGKIIVLPMCLLREKLEKKG